ncbi:MAG: N-acetylmuramoyl-L-alanine amidase [Clostridium fessum]
MWRLLFDSSNVAELLATMGIGSDGRVVLCVDEANRSWCSSSNANDQRAVTIECAGDMTHPYAMTDAVYEKLVALCVTSAGEMVRQNSFGLATRTNL